MFTNLAVTRFQQGAWRNEPAMVNCHNKKDETIPYGDESKYLSGCAVKVAVARRGQHTRNDPGKTT